MSVAVIDAIEQAQRCFESGDYRATIEWGERLIEQFPSCEVAWRLLGVAHVEERRPAEAEHAFQQIVARNPRQPAAYLGLGVVAEERGMPEVALAWCQVAWELTPWEARYREPVSRLTGQQYGADGRLQLTQAALANSHAGAWRLRRAVREYRRCLAELPDRLDLQVGLAEALWRLGQGNEAATICREQLETQPALFQALVILADFEYQAGNEALAKEYRDRFRRIDPTGELVAALVAGNHQARGAFLLLSAEEQPLLEERVDAVITELPQIAPAPDFNYDLPRPDPAAADAPGEPIGTSLTDLLSPRVALETGLLVGDDTTAYDQGEFGGLQPIGLSEFDLDAPLDVSLEFETDEVLAGAALDSAESQAVGMADFNTIPPAGDAFRGWGEPTSPSQDVERTAGQPIEDRGTGYTSVLRDLSAQGFEPFDPADSATPAISGSGGANTANDDIANVLIDWENIDAEIASAIPVAAPSTDELRGLERLDLTPFTLDEEIGTDQLTAFKPFGGIAPAPPGSPSSPVSSTPPAAEPFDEGDPLAGIEPFSLDDLEDPSEVQTDNWERNAGESVLPSDEALDAVLGADPPIPSPVTDPFGLEELLSELPDSLLDGADLAPDPVSLEPGEPLVDPGAATIGLGPLLDDDDLAGVDAALAVTRQLDEPSSLLEAELADDFETRLSAIQTSAVDHLEQARATEPGPPPSDLFDEGRPRTDVFTRTDATRLASDEQLFERSRAAKGELVDEGLIAGRRELDDTLVDEVVEPSWTVDPAEETYVERTEQEDSFVVQTGATRDVDTLRASLQAAPNDDELRWWLAEALRERGEPREALEEYRWLIRNAPQRQNAVVNALLGVVEQRHEAEMAHRLLADTYRRQGDNARATSHAAMAMAERRRQR
jgi:tetratricopeptide (TPR) repeat protein